MRKKLALIQASRAILPVLVMLYHVSINMKDYWDYNFLHFTTLSSYGGVHYFFALSGFILFYIYKDKFRSRGQFKKYWLHRLIRIYPLYWILTCIAGTVLLLFPFLGPGNAINFESTVYSLLLLPNPQGNAPIIDVAWALIYIMYFYIIFSVMFLSNKVITWCIFSVWIVITLGFLTDILWTENSLPYYFFYEYNLVFVCGMLCAYLISKIKLNFLVSILVVGLGLIAYPLLWMNEIHHIVDVWYEFCLGIASAFVIFGIASIDMQKEITLPRWLNYLGNASLSIYLAHNLPLNAFSHLFYKIGVYEVIGGVATSILLLVMITCVGCMVHSYIEKPVVAYCKKHMER